MQNTEPHFFDMLDDLIVVLSATGRIIFTNQALQKKLGYTETELLAMSAMDLHAPSDRPAGEALFAAILRGEQKSCPLPLVTKSGHYLPVETRVWFGTWKGEHCIFGVSKDRRAEQEAKQRFELLFRHNPNPMALTNLPERTFIDINDAFLKLLGYSKKEVLGHTSSELGFFAKDSDREMVAQRLRENGHIADAEIQIRSKDGTIYDGLFWGDVIESQNSRYFLTVFIDVTEQKRVATALAHERERLERIIRATRVGTWEWNIQTGDLIINERWATMIGYTLEELAPLSNDTWKRLCHPDDAVRSVQAVQDHFSGIKEYHEIEIRMRHKDGQWVWVKSCGQVTQRDASGQPLWMMGTHHDITSRKLAEAEVARLSHLQRELMLLATEFVNVPTDRQDEAISLSLETMGRLIQADRAYLFAYDLKAATMSNTHEWCNRGISAEINNLQNIPFKIVPEWVAQHLRGELTHVPDVFALPPESSLRQILEPQGIRSLITLPLMQNGTCLGFVGFDAVREQREWKEDEVTLLRVLAELYAHFEGRRKTERAMLELQKNLTEARDKAQASARAKTLFFANMSHEIRTPLNAILGYAQIIARECSVCDVAHRVKGLTKSSEHLLELINDILEMARSEGQQITLTPRHFNFAQLLEDVHMLFAQRPEASALKIEVTLAPDVPRTLYADPRKIRQVLANLLSNAVKFTEKGCVSISASLLEPEGMDGYLLAVDVEDTGCGIPEADLTHIFDLFVRLENDKRPTGGIGLGLPLSRRYAHALGGDIFVTSQEGVGSRFRFTFRALAGHDGRCPQVLDPVIRLAAQQVAPDTLSRVPNHLLQRLLQKTRRGDIRQLRALTDEVAKHDMQAATAIRACCESYDYDTLRKLLEAAQGGNASPHDKKGTSS